MNDLELAKIYWGQFNKRRDFQWKVNLSFWGVIALVIGFCVTEGVNESVAESEGLRYLSHGLIFLTYVYWRIGLERSNSIEKNRAHEHMDSALSSGFEYVENRKPVPFWSPTGEIAMTLILLLISLVVTEIIKLDPASHGLILKSW